MIEAVYLLCAITSTACVMLLYLGYSRTGTRLLFWSALCFAGLAANNVMLFVDMVLLPGADLNVWRSAPALAGIMALIFGLISESKVI